MKIFDLFKRKKSLFDKLSKIQKKAQNSHIYIPDIIKYKLKEYWTIGLRGDCEDYALWCYFECKKIDLEPNLVYCKVNGEGHLVCSVDGWILDNNNFFVVPRDVLKYKWISMGTVEGKWYKIK